MAPHTRKGHTHEKDPCRAAQPHPRRDGGLAACTAAQRRTASTAAADALISDQQEAQLGAQVKKELEQKEKIKYVQDAEVVRYVNEVSTKRAAPGEQGAPGIPWKIHVIDDPKR